MKVAGNAVVAAPRARVWDALRDPAVLVRTIPGAIKLEATGGDTYRMTVEAGVASIKGVYQGEVVLLDPEPLDRFVMKASGQGASGTVDATVRVSLAEVDGGTRIDYEAEAVVGGMIGGVGQRVLTSVAKKTATRFFAAVDRDLTKDLSVEALIAETTGAEVTPVATPVNGVSLNGVAAHPAQDVPTVAGESGPVAEVPTPAEPREYVRPKAEKTTSRASLWAMLAAFGAGAGVALGSTVIGWLLGRSGRRRP
ncbi:SRPBCC family protein [Rhizohabitans arisaemae]|uniref:SRPBCC family protein n=1 Tax=Rhizohabitans arisaemae TaxID=2720610 RepID=UPI0024B04B9A|nr:carbon monoxide dehydrogenase subunit G [Rhizohabitans arisaemae]